MIPVAHFWAPQLVLAMLLNGIVQAIQIGAYAARLAGVQSGRIATSISLFNLFVTASRLAALFLVPALGALADGAADSATGGFVPQAILTRFEWQIRAIVFAGTIGTAIGAMLLPTFIMLFMRGIASFERRGSVLHALARLLSPRVMWSIVSSVRPPQPSTFGRFSLDHVPVKLLIFNTIVTAVYAIGVVAAYLASAFNLQARTTAVGLSGLINGIATISFTLVVDPTSAYITDQAAKGERPVHEVKSMVFFLSLTAIVGTLLSQLILVPAADVIAAGAHLFYHPHH
jgi:hypothetical protein